ncbi:MAG: glycerol-3-phosphate 1-O-acyltransferase PlsY [Phycisphaerales bacterium]|nr:glycerol-3-phosphate 1-O-acyltransferase PlsY [Phycisphaerales bacterium]
MDHMSFSWQIVALFFVSYLIGGIPFGLIVSRIKGIDIRRHGSGNYGATNVGRVLGRKWGVLVLSLDAIKGGLTSVGAMMFLQSGHHHHEIEQVQRDFIWLGTGLCCVIGNIAPAYLRFKGGKGVATTLGVILGIWPYLTLPALATTLVWTVVVMLSRYVSLGSIVAAGVLPLAFLLISRLKEWPLKDHYPLLGLTLVVGAMILVRHRSNIGRLLAGTENRIGEAKS